VPFGRIGVLPNAAKKGPAPGLFVTERSDEDDNHRRNGDRRAHGSAADHPGFVFFRRKKGDDKLRHANSPLAIPPGDGSGYFIPEPRRGNYYVKLSVRGVRVLSFGRIRVLPRPCE